MRRFLLIVAGVGFIGWAFYFGITWGPSAVDAEPQARAEMVNPQLLEESQRLAREFEAIAAQRDPSEQELGLLRDAIAKQREYNLARAPSLEDRRRQEEMERRLAYFQAKDIHAESLEAEKEADSLLAAGQVMNAVASTQRAFDLQRRINQRFGSSGFRDVAREGRLQQQLLSMEAEPLHRQSLEFEQQAQQAQEDFRWDEARRLLTDARDLQGRINQESRRSAYYNPARHQQLGDQIALLRVGEMMSEVMNLQEEAEEQEKAGQWERAAQLYERAMVGQNGINRDHPQSRFVSTERVTELDVARQTALSTRQALELQKALTDMHRALVEEDFALAGQQIETARRLVVQLAERFPRSRHSDFEVRLEVEYLAFVQAALPELQEMLRADLLPVPGIEGWKMSTIPVSQRVYSRVMSANPSRHPGEDLPVDSVTLSQAREFCRRASWILARPVQLPSRNHFEAALGDWDPEIYASLSWHKENSGGKSHAVMTGGANPHGFFHLVGNLRHWLDDSGENGSAWTAGASYAEEFPGEDLFRETSQTTRAPTVGFRYMVAVDSRR